MAKPDIPAPPPLDVPDVPPPASRQRATPTPPAPQPSPNPPAPAAPNPDSRGVAVRNGDLVSTLLAGKGPGPQTGEPPQDPGPAVTVQDMIRLRRKHKDPFQDYVNDGTRMLAWVQDTIALVANLTGRTLQEVTRDALLGVRPLPKDLLAQHFQERYGYPMPEGVPNR